MRAYSALLVDLTLQPSVRDRPAVTAPFCSLGARASASEHRYGGRPEYSPR
jgi:hypothetical protein